MSNETIDRHQHGINAVDEMAQIERLAKVMTRLAVAQRNCDSRRTMADHAAWCALLHDLGGEVDQLRAAMTPDAIEDAEALSAAQMAAVDSSDDDIDEAIDAAEDADIMARLAEVDGWIDEQVEAVTTAIVTGRAVAAARRISRRAIAGVVAVGAVVGGAIILRR